jgi:hypothetical protein
MFSGLPPKDKSVYPDSTDVRMTLTEEHTQRVSPTTTLTTAKWENKPQQQKNGSSRPETAVYPTILYPNPVRQQYAAVHKLLRNTTIAPQATRATQQSTKLHSKHSQALLHRLISFQSVSEA